MMSGVHRSARISAALAIGQYSPYPRPTVTSIPARTARASTDFVLPWAQDRANAVGMRLLSTSAGFEGELIRPGDAAYDQARRLWNGAIDRHPALIARCSGPGDAAAALTHALEARAPVTVRGGGHNVGGWALADGGVAIDFSATRGVQVDGPGRRARVQPGALWGDFDAATQGSGLGLRRGS